jgi:succinyl-diaminopimelate desuccinylase
VRSDDELIRRRIVALARDLILIPSVPSQPDDRRRCCEFVKNHLEAENGVVIHEYGDRGIPSLVATADGSLEPEILMCAYLYVITHPDIAFYRSEIKDGRIVDPGAVDMKGSLAILMNLFREFHQRRPGSSLGLAVTLDEETGGESGTGFLFQHCGLRCGNAMIPDGGSLNKITIDEKGILHLKVGSHGHPAHAARPSLGDNPIEKLMVALECLTRLFGSWTDASGYWHPTCAVTVIGTENETVNRIPADAHLDVLFTYPHKVGTMLDKIKDCLGPEIESEVIVSAEAIYLSPDPIYREVTETITGRKVKLMRDSGGSDARFICHSGISVQMSRPFVGNLHAADE